MARAKPVKLQINGAAYLLPFAKKKLALLRKEGRLRGIDTLDKLWVVNNSDRVYIKVTPTHDVIRLDGGAILFLYDTTQNTLGNIAISSFELIVSSNGITLAESTVLPIVDRPDTSGDSMYITSRGTEHLNVNKVNPRLTFFTVTADVFGSFDFVGKNTRGIDIEGAQVFDDIRNYGIKGHRFFEFPNLGNLDLMSFPKYGTPIVFRQADIPDDETKFPIKPQITIGKEWFVWSLAETPVCLGRENFSLDEEGRLQEYDITGYGTSIYLDRETGERLDPEKDQRLPSWAGFYPRKWYMKYTDEEGERRGTNLLRDEPGTQETLLGVTFTQDALQHLPLAVLDKSTFIYQRIVHSQDKFEPKQGAGIVKLGNKNVQERIYRCQTQIGLPGPPRVFPEYKLVFISTISNRFAIANFNIGESIRNTSKDIELKIGNKVIESGFSFRFRDRYRAEPPRGYFQTTDGDPFQSGNFEGCLIGRRWWTGRFGPNTGVSYRMSYPLGSITEAEGSEVTVRTNTYLRTTDPRDPFWVPRGDPAAAAAIEAGTDLRLPGDILTGQTGLQESDFTAEQGVSDISFMDYDYNRDNRIFYGLLRKVRILKSFVRDAPMYRTASFGTTGGFVEALDEARSNLGVRESYGAAGSTTIRFPTNVFGEWVSILDPRFYPLIQEFSEQLIYSYEYKFIYYDRERDKVLKQILPFSGSDEWRLELDLTDGSGGGLQTINFVPGYPSIGVKGTKQAAMVRRGKRITRVSTKLVDGVYIFSFKVEKPKIINSANGKEVKGVDISDFTTDEVLLAEWTVEWQFDRRIIGSFNVTDPPGEPAQKTLILYHITKEYNEDEGKFEWVFRLDDEVVLKQDEDFYDYENSAAMGIQR